MMATAQKQPADVRQMFERIAHRYDRVNRVITLGQDRKWRQRVLQLAAPPPAGSLLDLGTGTGAIARQAARQMPGLHVVGCDFAARMLQAARIAAGGSAPAWALADALRLPFPDESFDCITSGYLVRNVADISQAFKEQARVLRRGGRVVCLETAPPPRTLVLPFISLYLHYIMPRLGQLIVGDRQAYRYLTESTIHFQKAEKVAELMEQAGLKVICIERRMLGTQTIIAATSA